MIRYGFDNFEGENVVAAMAYHQFRATGEPLTYWMMGPALRASMYEAAQRQIECLQQRLAQTPS